MKQWNNFLQHIRNKLDKKKSNLGSLKHMFLPPDISKPYNSRLRRTGGKHPRPDIPEAPSGFSGRGAFM
jgi:hypothetical protein